jgi:hypothetical protein
MLNSKEPPFPSVLQSKNSEIYIMRFVALEADARESAPPPEIEEQFMKEQLSKLNAEALTSTPLTAPPCPNMLCESEMLLLVIFKDDRSKYIEPPSEFDQHDTIDVFKIMSDAPSA